MAWQKGASDFQEVVSMPGESIYGKLFLRRISRWLTPIVAKTPVTPNGVTLFSIVLGVAGVGLLIRDGLASVAMGTAMIFSWTFLDCLDGDLARYTNRKSLLGVYIDMLGHYVVNPGVVAAVPLYLFLSYGDLRWLFVAFFVFLLAQGQRLSHEVFQALCYQQIAVGASPRHYMGGKGGSDVIHDEFMKARSETYERVGWKGIATQGVRLATDPCTVALGYLIVRCAGSLWDVQLEAQTVYLVLLVLIFALKFAANFRIRVRLLRQWHDVGA